MSPRWREQYERVKRWRSRLGDASGVDARHVDDFYAFFVCCYHLKDWIENDDSLIKSIREEVKPVVENNRWLALSGDITNGFKHLKRNRPAHVDVSAHVEAISGTGLDGFGLDVSQLGGIVIVGDQSMWDAREVADRCIEGWDDFLRGKGLV